ncbi:MAG: DUF2124 domain-containing protein [Methanosarcinaceae archaeon]|nr:DUF2124 domain-containing protein [Methanosarcinaceae archaeon]
MQVINTSKGIGGQLTEFRKLVKDSKKITFIGTPGFCTPFAELMSFVLRDTDKEMAFLPGLNKDMAQAIVLKPNGMQLDESVNPVADTVVLLGGLAMPKTNIDPKIMKNLVDELLENEDNKLIIGVCFQSMFIEQKWTDFINFDYIIDADLTNNIKK